MLAAVVYFLPVVFSDIFTEATLPQAVGLPASSGLENLGFGG